ncbi:hypothetical protein L596_001399 [Steinernema carpocapsae]|uniref:Uncharacterized protein n=1 Tax=Steinernema carpocapsae TaxID=34508 RepID=A0A4U8UNN6_STECR|nr:hypothetical protein L596_001399 [Steinernema carpocapsae]
MATFSVKPPTLVFSQPCSHVSVVESKNYACQVYLLGGLEWNLKLLKSDSGFNHTVNLLTTLASGLWAAKESTYLLYSV